MQQLLAQLGPEQTALDLGCGSGSIAYGGCPCRIVGVDLRVPAEAPRPARGGFVRADATHLPLADSSCDLVIANHTLEHIRDWRGALREAARVLKPEGVLVASVPDGYCLSDAVYRFLDKGREHVNRFRLQDLVAAVERENGLRLSRQRLLYSSYSFLNRQPGRRFGGRASVLNWLPAGLLRGALLAWNALVRAADRRLGTRWSIYGWMLYFRRAAEPAPQQDPAEPNVCIACGSSHPGGWLLETGRVRGRAFRCYDCPSCGALNLFFKSSFFLARPRRR